MPSTSTYHPRLAQNVARGRVTNSYPIKRSGAGVCANDLDPSLRKLIGLFFYKGQSDVLLDHLVMSKCSMQQRSSDIFDLTRSLILQKSLILLRSLRSSRC